MVIQGVTYLSDFEAKKAIMEMALGWWPVTAA